MKSTIVKLTKLTIKLLLYLATVIFIGLIVWQRSLIGCIYIGHTEPVTSTQLNELAANNVIVGAVATEITAENSAVPAVSQPTIAYAKMPTPTSEKIPGLAGALVRCIPDTPDYNQVAIQSIIWLAPILVIAWLIKFWLIIKKRKHEQS